MSVTSTTWIQHQAGVCGGEACIRATRHTVSGLVEWKQLGLSDEQILKRQPNLTQADLNAAWDYYKEHTEQIADTMRRNNSV